MTAHECDLSIVGNGAIANALALVFSERIKGIRIALIGPKERPGCASLAAGAMLNAFAELEEGSLDHPVARKKFSASREASRLWPGHLALLNSRLKELPPVRISPGTHVISNACADSLDDANFNAIIGYLKEYGEPFREIDPREIKGIAPAPRSRPLRAITIDNEGAVGSKHLHRAYDEALSRTPGITLFDTTVDTLDVKGPKKIVGTRDGRAVSSRQVILAAGIKTQELLDQLGLEAEVPRMVYGIGVSLILKSNTEVPRNVLRTPNRGLACGVYVVPYEKNYCYVGATNHVSPTEIAIPRVHAVSFLLSAAMDQVNSTFFKAEIHKTIVGYRPTTLDTFPLLGRLSADSVWVATGTKRDGFHLSPRIADEFVRCFEDGSQAFSGTFQPERKLILETPREPAIRRTVAHIISTGYQHGFRLPHSNWEPLIEDAVRRKVLEGYEACGLSQNEFGIPPELLDMYRYGHARKNLDRYLGRRGN